MNKRKIITFLVTACLSFVQIPMVVHAAHALWLDTANINVVEKSLLGVTGDYITASLIGGSISREDARNLAYSIIYRFHENGWDWAMAPTSLVPESVTINPETGTTPPEAVIVGSNISSEAASDGKYHQYLRAYGPTPRANGTDAYFIVIQAREPDSRYRDSEIFAFKGSDGLILDKTVEVSDVFGRTELMVSANEPGIYILTAACILPDPVGLNFKSIELEFVSDDVELPVPIRPKGELTWEHDESELPIPEIPDIELPVISFDHSRSTFEIENRKTTSNGTESVGIKVYAKDAYYIYRSGNLYIATSVGTDFWTGDNAWILADGVRLTETVGAGKSAAFVLPVKAGRVDLQFVSRVPVDFSFGIGVNQQLAEEGVIYQYTCGKASALDAKVINNWNNEVHIDPARISITTMNQANPDVTPIPVPLKVQIQINSGSISNSVRFNYYTIMPGGVNRTAFMEMLAEMKSVDQLLICAGEKWYDVKGITLLEAVQNGRLIEARADYMALMDNGAEVSVYIGNLVDELNNLATYDGASLAPYYEAYLSLSENEKTAIADLPEIQDMLNAIS